MARKSWYKCIYTIFSITRVLTFLSFLSKESMDRNVLKIKTNMLHTVLHRRFFLLTKIWFVQSSYRFVSAVFVSCVSIAPLF